MKIEDLEANALFTINGKDIWELESFCLQPTCKLKNLRTGEIKDFGLGGLTSESFKRVTLNRKS